MAWYVVDIESEGSGVEEASDEVMERLRSALEEQSLRGVEDKDAQDIVAELVAEAEPVLVAPVIGWGGLAGGPSVRVSVRARTELDAAAIAKHAFDAALDEAEVGSRALARVDVMTESYQDDWLAEQPEELVGVTEIAAILDVSRQRVSELSGQRGFPKPVAELASGPVWRLSSLQRFIAAWPRRPGRPSTSKIRLEEVKALARSASAGGTEPTEGRRLTSRERQVLQLVAEGRSLDDIAQRLGVARKTLDSHVRSVIGKIRERTYTEPSPT